MNSRTTNPPAIVRKAESLAECMKKASYFDTAVARQEQSTLKDAIEEGNWLNKAKAICPHGQWAKELSKAKISERRASERMAIAKLPDAVISTCTSIRDAVSKLPGAKSAAPPISITSDSNDRPTEDFIIPCERCQRTGRVKDCPNCKAKANELDRLGEQVGQLFREALQCQEESLHHTLRAIGLTDYLTERAKTEAFTAKQQSDLIELEKLVGEHKAPMRLSLAEWFFDTCYRELKTGETKVIGPKLQEQATKLARGDWAAASALAHTMNEGQWWKESKPKDPEGVECFDAFQRAFHEHEIHLA
jgi:hypothetical protein